jgi:O-antigen ligase
MPSFFSKFTPTSRRLLWLLVLWQLIAVMLLALGVWPEWVAWVNVGLTAVYLLFAETFDGLLLLIASIPFFVVVPNPYSAVLASWRLLFVWLFVLWVIRTFVKQRQYIQRIKHFRQIYREAKILEQSKLELFWVTLRRIDSRFLPWDKYLALFLFVSVLSLIFARFPVQSLKQMAFLINVYLLYMVLINVTTTREKVIDLIKYAAASVTIIVLLGYVQFIATLFVRPYYFWQYWATMVSRVYYGLPLSNVLIYSNSWFSYTAGRQELRMFSIMPDSHSFAMVAVFAIGFLLALVCYWRRDKTPGLPLWRKMNTRNYWTWYLIRFTGLAVILSGTRGVWVGMLPPLLLSGWLWWRRLARPLMKKVFLAESLIILFFLLSPLINYGLNVFRVSQFKENFLGRAASIYDLSEDSNVGRLIIWRDSLTYALIHPFGVGAGNFVVSLVRDVRPGATYEQLADQRNLRYNVPQKFVTAHSLYLNILVELGFAGLLVFAVFWWEYFSTAWRFIKEHRSEDNIFVMFVLSLAFTMLWFVVYGIFDVTLLNDKVLMYFFISLGTAGIILRRYDSFEESRLPQPDRTTSA